MDYIGKQIGNYTITRFIDKGGMASVYEGEHEILGTKAAIKILNPILSENKQIRDRFKNEARIMASLDHPNITRVLDFKESDAYLAITMEFLAGEDLSKLIKKMGKLTDNDIKNIFEQILSAFHYAHGMGIMHRDIKPSNIFILPNGTVKILDFGIAKLFGQGNEMTQTGTQMGTPIYMSPEQVKADKTIDHKSDIYSLGVTLFYALNGKPPYDGNTTSQFDIFNKIVYDPLPEIGGNSYLNDLVIKACQKEREKRFQNCEEWLQALKNGITQKKETTLLDNTIVDPKQSDKTLFEIPKVEKTAVEPTGTLETSYSSTQNSSEFSSSSETMHETKKANLFIGIIVFVFIVFLGFFTWPKKRVEKVGDANSTETINSDEIDNKDVSNMDSLEVGFDN
jgi:serine/threonine protein kinase